jgi:3-methyl-2-oxobutanoate hydroxymethyltransferase
MAKKKVTVPDLRAMKSQGRKISMLTAYDATMARLLDEGGVDVLLVGDSLGMVVQGHAHTLSVTVDEICYHGRAVARGASFAHIVGDMPFMSFQLSPEDALRNAGKMMKEGSFEAIKLEGGLEVVSHVKRIVEAGIPVMGHVGLTPQSIHAMGGFRVQGKSDDDALRILEGAKAIESAGAYALVLEGIPADLAKKITNALTIPTIGIGAGVECDGQVLVCYDFLGMYGHIRPKFVKRFGELGNSIVACAETYVAEVQAGTFPGPEHSFGVVAPKPRGEATGAEPLALAEKQYGPVED